MNNYLLQVTTSVFTDHLFEILTFMGAVIAAWLNLNNKVTINKTRIEAMEVKLEEMREENGRVMDKLDEIGKEIKDIQINLHVIINRYKEGKF